MSIPNASPLAALTVLAAAALAAGPGADGSAARPRAYFVLGQQLVAVPLQGQSVRGVVRQLAAGPDAAARRRGVRSFVPRSARVRSSTRSGGVATVDLNRQFGRAATADARIARLAQLVYSVTSLPGIRAVRVRIGGRTPAPGRFPRIDVTRPITRAEIARPKLKLPKPPQERRLPPSPETRRLQQRLADLSFLPAADVDGRPGPETAFAITAFQKWAGLARDGVAGPATMKALATAQRPLPIVAGSGKRIEVLIDRQLTLLEKGSQVALTVPVSTGKGSNATPIGSFRIFRKEIKSWSYPFQVWLPWASYFVGGVAFHEYPDVPTQAASHGCVRVPRYWSQRLYRFAPLDTRVRVIAKST